MNSCGAQIDRHSVVRDWKVHTDVFWKSWQYSVLRNFSSYVNMFIKYDTIITLGSSYLDIPHLKNVGWLVSYMGQVWPNGSTDQDAARHAGCSRPRSHVLHEVKVQSHLGIVYAIFGVCCRDQKQNYRRYPSDIDVVFYGSSNCVMSKFRWPSNVVRRWRCKKVWICFILLPVLWKWLNTLNHLKLDYLWLGCIV